MFDFGRQTMTFIVCSFSHSLSDTGNADTQDAKCIKLCVHQKVEQ